MRLRDEDCTIILIEIAKVKEEIGEVKEVLHKIGRKFGVFLFFVPEVALTHPVSNATPPDSVPTMPKGAACKL
jgi:hypothetical protein